MVYMFCLDIFVIRAHTLKFFFFWLRIYVFKISWRKGSGVNLSCLCFHIQKDESNFRGFKIIYFLFFIHIFFSPYLPIPIVRRYFLGDCIYRDSYYIYTINIIIEMYRVKISTSANTHGVVFFLGIVSVLCVFFHIFYFNVLKENASNKLRN